MIRLAIARDVANDLWSTFVVRPVLINDLTFREKVVAPLSVVIDDADLGLGSWACHLRLFIHLVLPYLRILKR